MIINTRIFNKILDAINETDDNIFDTTGEYSSPLLWTREFVKQLRIRGLDIVDSRANMDATASLQPHIPERESA